MEEFPNDCDDVEYYEWAKTDGKVKKGVKSVDVEEAIELLNEQVKILKVHLFVKRTHGRCRRNRQKDDFSTHKIKKMCD